MHESKLVLVRLALLQQLRHSRLPRCSPEVEERHREDYHGPCARLTRTTREVYQGETQDCRDSCKLQELQDQKRAETTARL